MATQQQQTNDTTFRNIELLKEQTIGVGAYGSVCRAKCDSLMVAAKIIHPIIVFSTQKERGHRLPIERLEKELPLMRELRHPNIVQYFGMYRDPETGLPVLLMELMDESLTLFLESSTEPVPYHIQVGISLDVTRALSFLHLNGIIHRDLCSNNILLIGKGARAKLSDITNSKIIDVQASFSMLPGTDVYMAPEAMDNHTTYTEKGDVYSFGVNVIQILTRKFPDPGNRLRILDYDDYENPSGIMSVCVPEVERRSNHINEIDPTHPLLPIALDCLQFQEYDRPTASELCERLSTLKRTEEYMASEGRKECQHLQNELAERDQLIVAKDLQLETKEEVVERLLAENETLLAAKQTLLSSGEEDIKMIAYFQRRIKEIKHMSASSDPEHQPSVIHQQSEDLQESNEKIKESLEELETKFAELKVKHGVAHTKESDLPAATASILTESTDLPGVEVLAQTDVVVTNSPQTFKWRGYGFSLHVPADSLPEGLDRCILRIYSSVSGQYELPGNHELVSAVYWVRPEPFCKFKQQLTAEVQHCAQKSYSKNLSFVRAVCTQKTLPYTFKKIEGSGTFVAESSYGSIKLDHFSGYGVTAEGPVERLYTAGLYYLGRDVRSWEIHLVVTWDNEPHVTTIQRHYERESAVKGSYIPIEFVGERIELNVPMGGLPIGDWTIRPLARPQLAQKRVDYFRPGRKIPCCQLTAKFPQQGAAAPIPELYHPLPITGAKEPDNMITIEIDPAWPLRGSNTGLRGALNPDGIAMVTIDELIHHTGITDATINQQSTDHTLSLIAPYLPNWLKFAKALRLTDQEIQEIRTDLNLDVRMKAHRVLQRWRETNAFRATYRRLVEACLRLREASVAEKVCTIVNQAQ